MQVRTKNIPAVEITLPVEDARELAHILTMYVIMTQQGGSGQGTSIDDAIKFAEGLSAELTERTKI